MLRLILTLVQVFASVAIITLVLLQRGKGAEAGAGFGAGASGTVFGARGASTALSRMTAIFAAIFMLNSLLLTYMGTRAEPTRTILDVAGERAPTPAPRPQTPGGAQLPAPPLSAPAVPGAPPADGAPATDSGAVPPPVVPPAATQAPAPAPQPAAPPPAAPQPAPSGK